MAAVFLGSFVMFFSFYLACEKQFLAHKSLVFKVLLLPISVYFRAPGLGDPQLLIVRFWVQVAGEMILECWGKNFLFDDGFSVYRDPNTKNWVLAPPGTLDTA